MKSGTMLESEYGRIYIDRNVIAQYAGSVAVESFGIVGMAAVNVKDGLVRILKRDHISHGIHVSLDEDNGVYLDFHVIISYGVNISSVTDNLIESVKQKLNAFTGLEVKKVNVLVEGIRVID